MTVPGANFAWIKREHGAALVRAHAVAASCGTSLAVCGVMLQSLLRNALSAPYLLGISAGASSGSVAVAMLGLGSGNPPASRTEPRRVLELACGTGEVTQLLLSFGHDVTALDFSDAMLARTRPKHEGNERVRFILADADNPMEPDASYDAILCRHLVWTLTEPRTAFAEWRRILKP